MSRQRRLHQCPPATCPSKVFLIYSWDECDEGGGLIPTLGDPAGMVVSHKAHIQMN